MDEILDIAELAFDFELEGIVATLLRVVGLVAILAGLGLWLLTDAGLFVLPAALMATGLLLLVVPSVLLAFGELAG